MEGVGLPCEQGRDAFACYMLQVIWNSKMREEVLAQLESSGEDPQASVASAQVGA